MEIKRIPLYLFLLVLIAMSMTACERSLAPQTGQAEPSPTIAEIGEPSPSPDNVMDQLGLFATQTAVAAGQVGEVAATEPPAAEETQPAPPEETETTPPEQQETPIETEAPTAEPAVVVPPPTPGIPSSYTLKPGEYPYCIARRFNVNPAELLRINGLSASAQVFSGLTLQIPQSGGNFPGNAALRAHPTTYSVRQGENIYEVACAFGDVSPEAIAAANGLEAPYNLSAGQTLQIP